MSTTPRNTTQRDRDRNAIRRTKPPCGICEGEIDYALPHTDPRSFVVDHIIPLSKGGADALPNKQAAHRLPVTATEPSQTSLATTLARGHS